MGLFQPVVFFEKNIFVPPTPAGIEIDYLVVAGGGAGGDKIGGGGGAGGMLTGSWTPTITGSVYTTIVGAGAAKASNANGLNSSLSGSLLLIESIGGGHGDSNASGVIAGDGGSGGGQGYSNDGGGLGTAGQGNDGGSGSWQVSGPQILMGGGGGGALQEGQDGSPTLTANDGGEGGSGSLWLDGLRYAGGGGGNRSHPSNTIGAPGGPGGGGRGASDAASPNNPNVLPTAGSPNTGGGGGGAAWGSTQQGEAGGSGIVKLRYTGSAQALGGTITESDGYTYHTYTSTGTGSFTWVGDTDAAVFLITTNITDTTIVNAIEGLVTDLKSAGLWDKIDALYPMVGGTSTTNSYNLKDVSQYQITFSGGVTHNVSGSKGDGINGVADTGLNARTDLAGGTPTDGCHMFMYIQGMVAEGGLDIGVTGDDGTGGSPWHLNSRNPTNVFNTRNINATLDGTTLSAQTSGVFAMSRTSSSSYFKSFNKSHTVLSRTSFIMPNTTVSFMAQHSAQTGGYGDYQTRMFSLVSLGSALSQAEVDDFVDINQTFQTALGRFA
jgi:hypothetical protein